MAYLKTIGLNMKLGLEVAVAVLAIGIASATFAQQKDTVDPRTMQQIRALTMKYEEAYNSHRGRGSCDDSQRSKARSGGHRETL
jgi:hypothetical protein